MAAITTAIQQVQGLDTLSQLVELIKDPSRIKATHDLARQEMILTEAEKVKYEDARLAISRHENVLKDIADKQESLRVATEAIELRENDLKGDTEKFLTYQESESKRLASLSAEIDTKQKQQSETDKAHSERQRQMDYDASIASKQFTDERKQLDARKTLLDENAEDLKAFQKELQNYEKTLREKAKKLRESAADI